MISLSFEKVLKFNSYILKSKNQELELTLEFFGVNKPIVGDKLLIHSDLLDKTSKIYSQPYAFELVDEDPKLIKQKNDREFIVLRVNKKNCVLKRIYG